MGFGNPKDGLVVRNLTLNDDMMSSTKRLYLKGACRETVCGDNKLEHMVAQIVSYHVT